MSYTTGQTSKLLDIPSSTIRRYVAAFGGYLSPEAKRRRARTFSENDLTVLSKIRDLATQGIKLADIPQHLTDIIDQLPPQDISALALPGLLARMDENSSRLDHLHAEFDQERQRQKQWEDYHRQLARWEALPWLQRIRTPRPQPPQEYP